MEKYDENTQLNKINDIDSEINNYDSIISSSHSQNLKLKENISSILNKNEERHIIDHIVESIGFSRYHLATILVGIFSMLVDGILSIHFATSQNLLIKKFNWRTSHLNLLYCLEILFISFGGLVSTTSRSIDWDVSSNILIAAIGFLSTIMISLYSDPFIYSLLILIFCLCHGFINNICTNYILEMLNKKSRGFYFLFVLCFKKLGMVVNLLTFINLYQYFDISGSNTLVVGLSCTELFLAISLIYLMDSPRILFHNNELVNLYEYILIVTGSGEDPIYNQHYKSQIITKLEQARKEIESNYGNQKNEGLIYTYINLFNKTFFWNMTIKSIIFIFLSTLFMLNLQLSTTFYFYNFYGIKNENVSLWTNIVGYDSITDETKINYTYFIFLIFEFTCLLALSFAYYYLPNIKRIFFNIFSISICFIFMILFLVVKNYFNYFAFFIDVFSFFYFCLIYLYLSENTTTKLRNCLTSLMLISYSVATITAVLIMPILGKSNPNYLVLFNFLVGVALILMDLFWIDNTIDTKNQDLQEIEFMVLRHTKSS